MKLVVYSTKKSEEQNIGWHRAGSDYSYFANGIRKTSKLPKSLYSLRFSYTFEHNNDIVYFAYSYPYTFTQLTEYLDKLEANKDINE